MFIGLGRKLLVVFGILARVIFVLFPLHSQVSAAKFAVTELPQWGRAGEVKGYVYGADASTVKLFAYIFVPDMGWFSKPGCASVPIRSTGEFSADLTPGLLDRNATHIRLFLVPSSLPVNCVQSGATLPFIVERNAMDSASFPRIPAYKTLSFSGMDWHVKSAPLKVYPGPQFFVEENAFVDGQGRLHLRVSRCQDSWCAAEIFTKERVGTGTYTFTVETQLNNLDPNITLGLFTWDELAAEQFHREWDIEFARWGDPNASFNAQYVVQPYTEPNRMFRFLMSPAVPTFHRVEWGANSVNFTSSSGSAAGGPLISSWTSVAGILPTPKVGDARLHLNLYVADGRAPRTPVDREIIISRVQLSS